MSSYIPPAGTYQPEQPSQLRQEPNRARTNSATAERYRPRTYSNPPPSQPDPILLGPHQHPYTPPDPSFYPQQPHQHPPYPEQTAYPQTQAPIPMPQPAIGIAGIVPSYPNPPGPSSRHSSYAHSHPTIQPTQSLGVDEDSSRRHSYSSQHSRHSHDSRHSHESRVSRDSKRSRHSKHSVDDRHEGKAHGHGLKKEHPNRTNERPTMGDSLVSMFGLIKSALGPRDK